MYRANEYIFPQSLDEAADILSKDRQASVIGGGLWMRLSRSKKTKIIDLSRLGLGGIETCGDTVSVGAMATLREFETDPILSKAFGGVLKDAVSSIVGVQLRNSATVGGTVYGRFGFSDPLCALLALDAEVELQKGGIVPLEKYVYMKYDRDIIKAVRLRNDGRTAVFKSLRQTRTDFPVINLTLARLPDGSFRVAVGARPRRAERCPEAEKYLEAGDIGSAVSAVAKMHFGTNSRGSSEYRAAMAGELLRRAYSDLGGDAV